MDSEHAKETCRLFCERYKGNVGLSTHVLDKLAEMGYVAWCTCSDCGKQFQAVDGFRINMDGDAYHGDGGIGVIMTRVLCEDCLDAVRCPTCLSLSLPNPYAKDEGESTWGNYDFLACVLHDWLGVCWACSDGYARRFLERYDECCERWVKTALGEELEKYVDKLEERHGEEGRELYESLVKTLSGKQAINRLRDLMQESVGNYFDDYYGEPFLSDRLDTEDPRQMKLEL